MEASKQNIEKANYAFVYFLHKQKGFVEEKSLMNKSDKALIISIFGLVISIVGFVVISICWSTKQALILSPVAVLNAYKVSTEVRERKKAKSI